MRQIPDDNLSYPALITLSDGRFGSGFFLHQEDATHLVTAKHNLFDAHGKLLNDHAECICYGRNLTTKINISLDLKLLAHDGAARGHATADVAVIKVAGASRSKEESFRSVESLPGVRVQGTSPPDGIVMGAPIESCRRYEDVMIANDIFIFGYPNSIGEKDQLDRTRPLLRKGIIAGKNDLTHSIIVDCPVYQGNSGGLVVERFFTSLTNYSCKPVGVVSSFVPFIDRLESEAYGFGNVTVENSGYAVVTPIDRVLEMIVT